MQGDGTTPRIGGPALHQRHWSCGFASETLADPLRGRLMGEEVDVAMSAAGEIKRDYRSIKGFANARRKIYDAV
jgi:hypothetical protein